MTPVDVTAFFLLGLAFGFVLGAGAIAMVALMSEARR